MEERFDKFTALILNINRFIEKIKSHEMEELGLKGNQVQCLFHLSKEKDGIEAGRLCRLCGQDKAVISRTIKELEAKNLVFVEESDLKKYKNPVKLTETGKKVAGKVCQKIDAFFAQGSKGVAANERQRFYEQLTTICENLKEIYENLGGDND